MILWDVKKAKEEIKDQVEDGICDVNDPRVLKRLNEAIRMLIIESDWKGTLRSYNICLHDCCITLPREVETVREAYWDCKAGQVRPIWFEYLEHGPGNIRDCCGPSCLHAMIDMGVYPVHTDPKHCLPLLVISDCAEDTDVEVTIQGKNCSGLEIFDCGQTGYSPGTLHKVDNSTPKYSNKCYSEITSIQKNKVSRGYIRVFSYCPDSFSFQQLSVIHPADCSPGYRRYKIPGKSSGSVGILAKITASELVHDTEILPIQNIDAIKQMLRAIRSDDAVNINAAIAYRREAVRLLRQEKRNFEGDQSGFLQVQGDAFALDEIGLAKHDHYRRY